jgi:aldose 1-epimerase
MKKILILFSVIICSCGGSKQKQADNNEETTTTLQPQKADFQDTVDGKKVDLFTLKNGNLQATITNYGGRIVSLLVPDKNGKLTDIVVGPATLKGFKESTEPYYGAAIGRYGNRIAKGKFTLDGKEYTLATNNGVNHLHGGKKGYQYVVWDAKQVSESVLELTYLSKDGEEGFPGNLSIKMTYTLTPDNGLKFDYEATTDKPTVCNLTNHAFYNLNGCGSGTVNNHVLQVNADEYTPVDATLIPLGKNTTVKNTPFDFTTARALSVGLMDSTNVQLKNGGGYDHNFALNRKTNTDLQEAATMTGDKSGIVMKIQTQEPGLQFYGGNFMQSKNIMKGGGKDDYRTSFALETQHFPDSPNQKSFPSTVLRPSETYKTSTIYYFSVPK